MRLDNAVGDRWAVWHEAGGKSEKAESTISLRRTVYPSGCEALGRLKKAMSQICDAGNPNSHLRSHAGNLIRPFHGILVSPAEPRRTGHGIIQK